MRCSGLRGNNLRRALMQRLGVKCFYAPIGMNANDSAERNARPSLQRRIAIILIVAAPYLFASGGFLLLPDAAARKVMSWVEPLGSVLHGFIFETGWQCAVVFGWIVLACLYLYVANVSWRRASVLLAIAAVVLAVLCAALLLNQQQHIAVAIQKARID